MYQQYAAFPGDTEERYAALWRAHPGWLASAEYARACAQACGIDASAGTLERWFRTGALAYFLDQLIDDQPWDVPGRRHEARGIYQRVVRGEHLSTTDVPDWVSPDLLDAAALFNTAMEDIGLDDEDRQQALRFLECAQDKASEQRAWHYSRHVTGEGRLMGVLFAIGMNRRECQDARRRRRFIGSFGHFAAGGALFDSVRDLGRDHREHRTAVNPTFTAHAYLGGWCLWSVLRLALYPRVFWSLFMVFPRFWGIPFRLDETWGGPGRTWIAKSKLARTSG
jgi:hypothetical protein